jgi:hypothetical protein
MIRLSGPSRYQVLNTSSTMIYLINDCHWFSDSSWSELQIYSDENYHEGSNGPRILKSMASITLSLQHDLWLTFVPFSFCNLVRWDPHRYTIVILSHFHTDLWSRFLLGSPSSESQCILSLKHYDRLISKTNRMFPCIVSSISISLNRS